MELKEILEKAEHRVYCKLNHVSKSGMMRSISLYVVNDNKICNVTWAAANVLGRKIDRYGGIRMNGCGMDMGFVLVYELSRRLYDGDEYKLKKEWL